MKITVVYDNCVRKAGLEAGWGFSALIQGRNTPAILFDTGADGQVLFHNMKKLSIDPESIGTIVISHTHWDHIGGLGDILEVNKGAEVYLPASSGGKIPGRKVTAVTGPAQIAENVFSTGELNAIEQSLVLKTEGGIVVVTGCSHPGVGEIIDAASGFGEVCGIIGGFHGFNDFDRLKELTMICPCHCTQYKKEIGQLFPEQYLACGAGAEIELKEV